MKIAFFSDCYLDLTGGIRSSINAQKKALEDDGHEVYIFTTGYPKNKDGLKNLAEQNIFQVPSCKVFFRGASIDCNILRPRSYWCRCTTTRLSVVAIANNRLVRIIL